MGCSATPPSHPSFPLPREGERTEGERAVPPPGVRGDQSRSRRRRPPHEILLPNRSPHIEWGPTRAKTKRDFLQRIDERTA